MWAGHAVQWVSQSCPAHLCSVSSTLTPQGVGPGMVFLSSLMLHGPLLELFFQARKTWCLSCSWTAGGKHTGFYPIFNLQYLPTEVQTICHKFKVMGNRVDFLSSLSPTDNPQGLQTIGWKLLALIDELPPLPHSLENCLSVSYLNKWNIPTPDNAKANNGKRDQFKIWVFYLLTLSIPTPLPTPILAPLSYILI